MERTFSTLLLLTILFAFAQPFNAGADEWSVFDPVPERPARQPVADDPEFAGNPIDAFVFDRLRRANLTPASAIGRRTWIRRVTYDLIGLPPAPEDVENLVSDPRDDYPAYVSVVDRLLASPRYGERWARHWLDVVRYADTDGFAIDSERPTLWRYRDYVIRAYNEDRPYDQFLREQLAGDGLPSGVDGLLATSFYRLGPWEADNMVAENRWQDYLNDVTSTIGTSMLGMTVGCARCHDHKYDPIPQADFYRLQAFVAPVRHANLPAEFLTVEQRRGKEVADNRKRELHEAFAAFRRELKDHLAKARQADAEIGDQALDEALTKENEFSDEQRKRHTELKSAAEKFHDAERFEAIACSVAKLEPDNIPKTRVLRNGDVFAPGEDVAPGFLSAVDAWDGPCYESLASDQPARRRLVLAEWISSPHNPLTARVYVNRIWQYHFGQGLSSTPNDFGQNGAKVTHPELLDFLTRSFVDQGWQLKPLHRLMVLSRTYRMSTDHVDAEACLRIDPENFLLWRAQPRRLESEAIRDALLSVSGRLNLTMGGPGFFEALPSEMETSYSFFDWRRSPDTDRVRRSVYMFQRRNLVHPFIEVFDGADLNQSCDRRRHSVTSPQVLTLMNSELMSEASRALAERLMRELSTGSGVIFHDRLFQLTLSRSPTRQEHQDCEEFLLARNEAYRATTASSKDPTLESLVDLCLAVLNTNEFLYLD